MRMLPVIFEEREIRRLYDEKADTWFFSVVDIVQVLTQQPDFQTARKYWNKLKGRLKKEGSQSVTNCHRLKLPGADGKSYLTDVARLVAWPQSPWKQCHASKCCSRKHAPEGDLGRTRPPWPHEHRGNMLTQTAAETCHRRSPNRPAACHRPGTPIS